MKILGIDPGYDRLGVAIVEKDRGGEKLIYSNCLISDKKANFAERLLFLGNKLEEIIKKHRPETLALEKLFFAKNQKTAMAVAEARGMINYLAAKHGLAVQEIAPNSVKLAITGYGAASKAQIITMLPKLIKLGKRPDFDDEYDAIAIALTGLSTSRSK